MGGGGGGGGGGGDLWYSDIFIYTFHILLCFQV